MQAFLNDNMLCILCLYCVLLIIISIAIIINIIYIYIYVHDIRKNTYNYNSKYVQCCSYNNIFCIEQNIYRKRTVRTTLSCIRTIIGRKKYSFITTSHNCTLGVNKLCLISKETNYVLFNYE